MHLGSNHSRVESQTHTKRESSRDPRYPRQLGTRAGRGPEPATSRIFQGTKKRCLLQPADFRVRVDFGHRRRSLRFLRQQDGRGWAEG
jgi:hypothetical protein